MSTGVRSNGLQVQVLYGGRDHHDAGIEVLNPSAYLTAGTQLLVVKGGRVHFNRWLGHAEAVDRPRCTQWFSAIYRYQRRGHTSDGPYEGVQRGPAPRRLEKAVGRIPTPEENA